MAGFDQSKDVALEQWTFGPEDEANTLIIGVYQYNGGAIKLGFTRTYKNYKTNEIGVKGAGRLTKEDVENLIGVLPKVTQIMKSSPKDSQSSEE